jgi:hypothetical protein
MTAMNELKSLTVKFLAAQELASSAGRSRPPEAIEARSSFWLVQRMPLLLERRRRPEYRRRGLFAVHYEAG